MSMTFEDALPLLEVIRRRTGSGEHAAILVHSDGSGSVRAWVSRDKMELLAKWGGLAEMEVALHGLAAPTKKEVLATIDSLDTRVNFLTGTTETSKDELRRIRDYVVTKGRP